MLKNGHMQREFPLFGPLQTMERYYNDVFGSYIDQIFAHNESFPMLQADSSCGCQNRGDANEVVGSGRENEEPFNQAATAVPGLAEATNGFQPAERLLDLLSLDRADAIARVASIADRRLVLFCDTCGVQPRSRHPATKSVS
jgi:hypothetical protein